MISATKELDNTGVRTRAIERQLNYIKVIPQENQKLLLDAVVEDEKNNAENVE